MRQWLGLRATSTSPLHRAELTHGRPPSSVVRRREQTFPPAGLGVAPSDRPTRPTRANKSSVGDVARRPCSLASTRVKYHQLARMTPVPGDRALIIPSGGSCLRYGQPWKPTRSKNNGTFLVLGFFQPRFYENNLHESRRHRRRCVAGRQHSSKIV